MTSTYVSYRLYSQNMAGSLARTAARADVSRDIQYYRDNIGKVTSVDQFLDDQKLFSVAMKAYGLEDMTYAKAFMRKVLESDLNDSSSFARKLADPRYITFAKAFNFGTTGTVSQSLPAAQSGSQEDDTVELYSEHRVRQGVTAAAEAQYYQNKVPTLTSVDDLIGDSRLFAFALTSVGLDPHITSAQYVRNVLTSDLSDPQSLANTTTDQRFRALAAQFSFGTDGGVAPSGSAQTAAQLDTTVYQNYVASGNAATPAAAAYNTTYFSNAIASIGSVDELIENDRLRDYALTAFGFDPSNVSVTVLRTMLTSDRSDPGSAVNQAADGRYHLLANAFNFGTDGLIIGSDGAQSAAQLEATKDGYLAKYDATATTRDQTATTLYRSAIDNVDSVDDLLRISTLYTYALQAFGLDPDVESKAKIRLVLTSDLSNPGSFANLQSDPRYRELAAAFNFGPTGGTQQLRQAQTNEDELATIRVYNTRVGSSDAEIASAKAEGTYYHDTIGKVASVDEFLADKRLMAYVSKAFALDGTVTSDTLRKALLSDPMDPDSFVNRPGQSPGLRQLAAAFNFAADGNLKRVPEQAAQSRNEILDTTDAYVRQTMEADAGSQSEGARLALYFQRKAPAITSGLSILADKALLKVAQTALGLPTSMSLLDIEAQQAMIEKRLDVADLQDPAKLEKFLARFSALYDIENGGNSAVSPAILLGGGGASIGTNLSLLTSMQSIKR
jgi:hypothetical protein